MSRNPFRRRSVFAASAIVAGLCRVTVTSAATYYVSNSGSNAAAGLGVGNSFATLTKAATVARAGDSVLLQRGSTFRESASFQSGLTIDAYGPSDAPAPVVSGSTRVTGWTPYAGGAPGTYVADLAQDPAGGYVFANKQAMTLARFPNSGWLRTTTWTEDSDGTNTVVSTGGTLANVRNADGYWDGANVRWHKHSWWFETRPVTASKASGQLTLGGKSFQAIDPGNKNGWGFYLDNKLEELDAPGEYYYDKQQKKLYLYAPGGANPNDVVVEASVRPGGLAVNGSTVRNLAFEHQKDYGLTITGATTVEQSRFEGIGSDAGGNALQATWGAKNAVVRNNTFANNFNVGINWNENPAGGGSSRIEGNTLTQTGTVGGYGGSGSWKAVGIEVANGRNVHIVENHIDGTGYAGILSGSGGTYNFIERNVVDNAMATLNDGAAIYIPGHGMTVRDNVVRNTRGGMESSGPWRNLAHGIWTDMQKDYHDQVIEGNTVVGSGGWGIFFLNDFNSTVRDNVLFGNDRGQLELEGVKSNPITGRTQNLPQNNTVTGNVLVGETAAETPLLFQTGIDYGTVGGNYYLNAATANLVASFTANWSPKGMTLAQWAAQYPAVADPNAVTLDDLLPAGLIAMPQLFVNDTGLEMSIPLQGCYVDVDGVLHVGSITLPGYDSAVLIPHPVYGDANLDGSVDAADLALMSLLGTTWGAGDFNGDGRVSSDDYALFNLGVTMAERMHAATVPEPAGVVLAAAPAAGLLCRRRRAAA